jgi:hypothetical protein
MWRSVFPAVFFLVAVVLSSAADAYQWRCDDCISAERVAIAAQLLKNEDQAALDAAEQALGGIRIELVVHQQVPEGDRGSAWQVRQQRLEAEYASRADAVTRLQGNVRLWALIIEVFTRQIVDCDCWR